MMSVSVQHKRKEMEKESEHPVESDAPFVHIFSEFPEKLMEKLNTQRYESSMCDVTIITNDGRSYRAHKAVLAACSHYLENELASLNNEKDGEEAEAVIHLGMISSKSFETLLELVYTSKLVLTNENVAQVLLAAEVLDLEQVSAICRQFLRSRITSKSVNRSSMQYESPNAFRDANNNIISDSRGKDFQRPLEFFKRGQSEESTASSSGVSSISSNNHAEYDDHMTSAMSGKKVPEPKETDILRRRLSQPEVPDSTEPINDINRPTSAPSTYMSKDAANDSENKGRHSPSEIVDVTSTDWCPDLNTPENKNKNTEVKGEFHGVDNQTATYKIKSEVHVLPEYYAEYNYPRASEQSKIGNGLDNDAKLPLNLSPSSPYAFPPYYNLSSSQRRSYDSVFENQSTLLDLNSTPSPRKKAKSIDQLPEGLPSYPTMLPPQGPSSLWASLYMLRSQALNSASLLQNRSNLCMPKEHIDIPGTPAFPRRQLQHSKSVVTSNALFCKLCRLEFTSEWALSMHYHLCHPMSYFYQPTDFSRDAYSNYTRPGMNATDEKAPVEATPTRQFPLMKSMSSPAKTDSSQNTSQTKEFQAKILGLFAPAEAKTSHRCYHCKKDFDSIFLLRKHKSMEHMKRPFRCHRCESAFPNKAGLSVHLRSHTGERPYRCKICSKAFTQLGHVQRHQKVHTGEKPYQCPLCQARVRDKASMHYHILAHQGVKPFQCDQCDARFTKRSSLVKHKNVHTGSFLYQCPQCKASFREKASLSRHVRSQHKDPCFSVSNDQFSATTSTEKSSTDMTQQSSTMPLNLHASSGTADEIQVA